MKEKIRLTAIDPELGSFDFETTVFKSKHKAPAIFITPIFGGFDYLEQMIARMFALSGFHAFVTDFMPSLDLKNQIPDLDVHDRTYKKSVSGLEALRCHLKHLPYVDDSRVGLFGMSLGGIFTALNTKINPNFKASVIIAGSGNHPKILAQSSQPIMKALKNLRKKHFHLSNDDEYEALMCAHNEMDSLKVSRKTDSHSIKMFISLEDDQVPTSAQMETWGEFNDAEVTFLKKSHVKMITTVPFLYFKEICRFYLKHLAVLCVILNIYKINIPNIQ